MEHCSAYHPKQKSRRVAFLNPRSAYACKPSVCYEECPLSRDVLHILPQLISRRKDPFNLIVTFVSSHQHFEALLKRHTFT
jgi:hypothetical protein